MAMKQIIVTVRFLIILFVLKDYVVSWAEASVTTYTVPRSVYVGSDTMLSCTHTPKESLIWIKWYKDDNQFFSYQPNDTPPYNFFNFGDLDVDMNQSFNGDVYLRNVSLRADGKYRCEVLANNATSPNKLQQHMSVIERTPTSSFSPLEPLPTDRRTSESSFSPLGPVVSWLLILILLLCH